jgi:hypothetical protein
MTVYIAFLPLERTDTSDTTIRQMRFVRGATETEVLEGFWSAELAATSRWTPADVDERRRQWRERTGLFDGFPDDVAWERIALAPDEVLAILYIDWDWWRTVSKGTRLATVAVEVQGRDEGDRAIAAAAATNPELIVVTDEERAKLVLLEGHVRLTAYAASPEYLPPELEVYLGVSPRSDEWTEW